MFFVLTDHGFIAKRYSPQCGIVCVTKQLESAKVYPRLNLAQADCRSVPAGFNPFVGKLNWDTGLVEKVEVENVG